MEAKQLVKNLGNLIPSRSFCVATTEWYNHKCSNGRQLYTSHCLSVLPGFDGSDCQRFEGNDVTELMEKVSEAFGEFCAAVEMADTEVVAVKAKHTFAINVYSDKRGLVETYCIRDTRAEAEEMAAKDVEMLSRRIKSGLHVRIDELDENGDYVNGTTGHALYEDAHITGVTAPE